MALFTTFCKECAGVALLDERSAKQGRLSCPRCGSHVAIVPGCSFTTDEQELFDDLVEVAREGALQPGRPRQLASEVAQTLRAGTDTGPLLERLVEGRAEGEHVPAHARRVSPEDLRGHVAGSPHEHAWQRERR